MNLLKETLECLKHYNKNQKDVVCVILRDEKLSWQRFKDHADFDYDSGYGGAEIDSSLCILGKDWWLERAEYDGSEWWEYKTMPLKPEKVAIEIKLKDIYWE